MTDTNKKSKWDELTKLNMISSMLSREKKFLEETLEILRENRLIDMERNIELYKYMTTPIEDITILPEININTDQDKQIEEYESKIGIISVNYWIIHKRISEIGKTAYSVKCKQTNI
jgi:hypothetical protein